MDDSLTLLKEEARAETEFLCQQQSPWEEHTPVGSVGMVSHTGKRQEMPQFSPWNQSQPPINDTADDCEPIGQVGVTSYQAFTAEAQPKEPAYVNQAAGFVNDQQSPGTDQQPQRTGSRNDRKFGENFMTPEQQKNVYASVPSLLHNSTQGPLANRTPSPDDAGRSGSGNEDYLEPTPRHVYSSVPENIDLGTSTQSFASTFNTIWDDDSEAGTRPTSGVYSFMCIYLLRGEVLLCPNHDRGYFRRFGMVRRVE